MTPEELDRFFRKVVKGPAPSDCWIWVGAIADDGYGRFAIRRDGAERVIRPQRLLFEHLTGRDLPSHVLLLHDCDVPICVHVTTGADSHLFTGDTVMNMRDREQKQRAQHGRSGMRGLARAQLAQRSRLLREVVQQRGWDREAIAAVLAGHQPDDPRLF